MNRVAASPARSPSRFPRRAPGAGAPPLRRWMNPRQRAERRRPSRQPPRRGCGLPPAPRRPAAAGSAAHPRARCWLHPNISVARPTAADTPIALRIPPLVERLPGFRWRLPFQGPPSTASMLSPGSRPGAMSAGVCSAVETGTIVSPSGRSRAPRRNGLLVDAIAGALARVQRGTVAPHQIDGRQPCRSRRASRSQGRAPPAPHRATPRPIRGHRARISSSTMTSRAAFAPPRQRVAGVRVRVQERPPVGVIGVEQIGDGVGGQHTRQRRKPRSALRQHGEIGQRAGAR